MWLIRPSLNKLYEYFLSVAKSHYVTYSPSMCSNILCSPSPDMYNSEEPNTKNNLNFDTLTILFSEEVFYVFVYSLSCYNSIFNNMFI